MGITFIFDTGLKNALCKILENALCKILMALFLFFHNHSYIVFCIAKFAI